MDPPLDVEALAVTRIEVCERCKRRLVIRFKHLCASCAAYHKGRVEPSKWRRKSVPS